MPELGPGVVARLPAAAADRTDGMRESVAAVAGREMPSEERPPVVEAGRGSPLGFGLGVGEEPRSASSRSEVSVSIDV